MALAAQILEQPRSLSQADVQARHHHSFPTRNLVSRPWKNKDMSSQQQQDSPSKRLEESSSRVSEYLDSSLPQDADGQSPGRGQEENTPTDSTGLQPVVQSGEGGANQTSTSTENQNAGSPADENVAVPTNDKAAGQNVPSHSSNADDATSNAPNDAAGNGAQAGAAVSTASTTPAAQLFTNGAKLKAPGDNRRILTVNTNAPGRREAPPLSPSANQTQTLDRSQDAATFGNVGPLRVGQSLATMHEDMVDSGLYLAAPPLSAGPATSAADQSGLRPSRHRSASSAAALALHGSGSSYVADRWSASSFHLGSAIPTRSIWERDTSGSNLGSIVSPIDPRKPFPQLQRGFSIPQQPGQDGGSLLGSSDIDQNFELGSSRLRGFSTSSFTPQSPFDLPIALGGALPMSAGFVDQPGLDHGVGTESRRHSFAGGPARDAGVIGGHRKAVGFEVGGPSGFGSAHRNASEAPTSRTKAGFGPFAGGSLAISDDDLASDFDFKPLQHELNRAKQEQEREQQQQQHDSIHFRVPSATAAVSGAHAASMPPMFGEAGFGMFGSSSPPVDGGMPFRSGLTRGGIDSLSASWDILTPSTNLGRSPQDSRSSLAEVSRQLHQVSIDKQQRRSSPPTEQEHAAGTETVKASPGTSPSGVKPVGSRYPLSPQAKAFTHIGSMGQTAEGILPPSQAMADASRTGSNMNMFTSPALQISSRQRSMSAVDQNSVLSSSMGHGFPTQLSSPVLGGGGYLAGLTSTNSVIASAFSQTFMVPPPTLVAPPPMLSDYAFSSLATLGPMPPSSGGPGSLGNLGSSGQHTDLQELGKGVPLSSLPKDTPLYIVEFKQGRTDLFFRYFPPGMSASNSQDHDTIVKADLVIVEADRGKDLGTVVNDSITVEQVQAFLAHQSELAIIAAGGRPLSDDASSASGGAGSSPSGPSSATRPARSINPKRLFTKATAADTSLLYSKAQDEERALQLCITKVTQRGLPMTVVAAEMQWDRRKLTFYYTASMRVDFRDLVKELFRLYKTRIWMCHLGHPSGTGMG